MTDTEHNAAVAKTRLTFLDYLADSLPKGTKLGLLINGILSVIIVIGLIFIFSKQLAQEAVREESIKRSKNTAAEVHLIKMQMDSILSNQATQKLNQVQILLMLSKAETRRVINESSIDTIKTILLSHYIK